MTVSITTPEQYAALRKIAEAKIRSAGPDGGKVLKEIQAAVAAT